MSIATTVSSTRPRILVVDDLYANRVAMRHMLARVDVDIVEAASGNEALTASLDHEFALILLDVQMPGMDGFEVAQLLHGNETTGDTPIIFVTAGSTDDIDRLKGYGVGAIDYIVKPLHERVLRAKVRNFLELYRSRCELKRALADLDERNAELEREIEERKHAERRARYLATRDALTDLPNRLLFIDRLATTLERAQRNRSGFALGYMDLDGFKQINDAYGHRAGDVVLAIIAERLLEHTRASDTTARFGGDEFALIFENVVDAQSCVASCDTLRQHLSESMVVPGVDGDVEVQVGVSLGLALYPDHGQDADRLMHNADCALYAVKYAGKGAVRLFREEYERLARRAWSYGASG